MDIATYTKDQFLNYLNFTLIPDLRESGNNATASDLEAATHFINGAHEVKIYENERVKGIYN